MLLKVRLTDGERAMGTEAVNEQSTTAQPSIRDRGTLADQPILTYAGSHEAAQDFRHRR